MSLTYLIIFILFLADAAWVIFHILRNRGNDHRDSDDDGGVYEDFEPFLDLPPGVSLPVDGPEPQPSKFQETEEHGYA